MILCVFALIVFLQGETASQGEKERSMGQLWTGMNWSKGMILIAGLVVYALIFNSLGFIASTTALLLLLLRTIDPMGWIEAIAESLLASFITFAVFDLWLKVQLPHGYIERLLF